MSSSDITTNPTESDCCTRTGNLSYCDVPRKFQEYSFLADNDNSREYHTLQICHANEDMKQQKKRFIRCQTSLSAWLLMILRANTNEKLNSFKRSKSC